MWLLPGHVNVPSLQKVLVLDFYLLDKHTVVTSSFLKASYVTGTIAHVSSFVSYPNTILQVKNVAAQDLNPEVLVVGSEF